MKNSRLLAVILSLLGVAVASYAQSTDSTSKFTFKGSHMSSILGSLSHQTAENQESVTTAEFGWSYFGFATDYFAPGVDMKVSRVSSGGDAITQLGIGPKFVGAFNVSELPIYPYFGIGYNLLVTWAGGSDARIGHLIKVGLGVVVEPVKHFGVPLEFTINFPVGEDSDFKIYGFSIGFAILGY